MARRGFTYVGIGRAGVPDGQEAAHERHAGVAACAGAARAPTGTARVRWTRATLTPKRKACRRAIRR